MRRWRLDRKLRIMGERTPPAFRTGDPLFLFDAELRIVSWNRAAEQLVGISAAGAVGRRCWEVLGGHDESGNLVCHSRCSNARLAREGWPCSCRDLVIRGRTGRRRVRISTLAVESGDRPLFLHLMLPRNEPGARDGADQLLTPRQHEVLALLAEGVPAKVVAERLGLAEATVRNHIRALLLELGSHSQLEAVAKARRLELVP